MRSSVPPSQSAPGIMDTRQRHPYRYNGWFLGVLCAAFAFSVITVVVTSTPASSGSGSVDLSPLFGLALLVYLATVLCIFVVDWHDFLTLHGHVDWRAMSWPARIGLSLLYLLLWIVFLLMPALYLGFAVKDTYAEWRKRPLQQKMKTSEMEAELGFVPPTEGACRRCGKPLQAGAEYCQYCGAPTLIKPRVCPVCAAVAQPDANYCPKCRAPLASPQSFL